MPDTLAPPSRARQLRATLALAVLEAKLYLRLPVAVFFGLAFPLLLLLMFGSLFGDVDLPSGGDLFGFTMIDFYLPALIAVVVAQAGLVSLPGFLATYREAGILKRYYVSPVPVEGYIGAHLLVQGAVALAAAAAMAVAAEALFDVRYAGSPVVTAAVWTLGTTTFFTMGFALGGLIRTPQTAQAVGNFLFLSMFFLSGAAITVEFFPSWLALLSAALPLTHFVDALAGTWMGDPLSEHAGSLAVLLGYFVVSLVIARRRFSAVLA